MKPTDAIALGDGDNLTIHDSTQWAIGTKQVVGVAAAIANAIYHATGKRLRELPITPENLLYKINCRMGGLSKRYPHVRDR